jgi:hypothetical protein
MSIGARRRGDRFSIQQQGRFDQFFSGPLNLRRLRVIVFSLG